MSPGISVLPPVPVVPVFISSTWLDLQPERAKVEAVVAGFRETKFSGMEYFGSRPEDTRTASLEEVDRCALYIGIFGGRYGSGITEAEYRRARERSLPCLIYIKNNAEVVDSDEGARERLRSLTVELGSAHTVRNFNTPDDLAAKVAVDLHTWLFDRFLTPRLDPSAANAVPEQITTLLKAVVEPLSLGASVLQALSAGGYAATSPVAGDAAARREREQLAALSQRVRQAWIAGVLERTVHAEVMLTIGRRLTPDAVDRPWTAHAVVSIAHTTVGVADTLSTLQVFGQAGKFLLVLGEPGSGKTVTLLELTRDLLDAFDAGQVGHLPVVLNLSTWRARAGSMGAWAADELVTTYYMPKPMARKWIADQRLILILDGLDEVPDAERESCVRALNTFLAESGAPGVAVSCRSAEYAALTTRVGLYSAITLQPLADDQVDAYLEQGGPSLSFLRSALHSNDGLRALARTPLMLAIMGLAFHGVAESPAIAAPAADPDSQRRLRDEMFALYTARMFARRRFDEAQQHRMLRQLSWLARSMRRHGTSVFWIERLQPTWLSGRSTMGYPLIAGGVVALAYTLAIEGGFGIAFDLNPLEDEDVLQALVLAGISQVVGVAAVEAFRLAASRLHESKAIRKQVSLVFLGAYLLVPGALMLATLGEYIGVFATIVLAFSFWIVYGARCAWRRADDDIAVSDEMRWSWPHAARGALAGVFIGLFFGVAFEAALPLFSGGFSNLTRGVSEWLTKALSSPLTFVKSELLSWAALAWGTLGAGVSGWRATLRERTVSPNDGVRNTALRAGRYAVFFGAVLFALFLRDEGIDYIEKVVWGALASLLAAGGVAASLFGGLDVIKHLTLRWQLAAAGQLPFRAADALNAAAAAIFLRRVGGGYVFIHRMLLEYFADQQVPAAAAGGSSAPTKETVAVSGSDLQLAGGAGAD